MSQPELADELLSRLTPPRPLSADQVARIRASIPERRRAPLRLAIRPLLAALLAITVLAPVTVFGLAVNVVPALIAGNNVELGAQSLFHEHGEIITG